MEDQPLAQIKVRQNRKGRLKTRHTTYLTIDHLNTPRLGTDEQQNTVWQWRSDGYGQTRPVRFKDAQGRRRNIRLRFPGQFQDQETGLYYNWNRYYDPKAGRYLTSDPIGLQGGLNTFAYVAGNPLKFTDPLGLEIKYRLWSYGQGWKVQVLSPGEGAVPHGGFLDPAKVAQCGLEVGSVLVGGELFAAKVLAGIAKGPLKRFLTSRSVKALPSLQVPNAGGKIVSDVTKQDEVFFRVFSGDSTRGRFLTKIPPTSQRGAVEGLALPPGNNADFIQQVLVPAGTRLQRSRALPAFGRRGGKEQFQLLDNIPNENFGQGIPFK